MCTSRTLTNLDLTAELPLELSFAADDPRLARRRFLKVDLHPSSTAPLPPLLLPLIPHPPEPRIRPRAQAEHLPLPCSRSSNQELPHEFVYCPSTSVRAEVDEWWSFLC